MDETDCCIRCWVRNLITSACGGSRYEIEATSLSVSSWMQLLSACYSRISKGNPQFQLFEATQMSSAPVHDSALSMSPSVVLSPQLFRDDSTPPNASVAAFLSFHQRVCDGVIDRRDQVSFWAAELRRNSLDNLFAFSYEASDDRKHVVAKLFKSCCALAQSNAAVRVKLDAWTPQSPHHLLHVLSEYGEEPGTSHSGLLKGGSVFVSLLCWVCFRCRNGTAHARSHCLRY